MPSPSSTTLISDLPPFEQVMVIDLAPASIEFSINSLIADDGLSITSPAAILFIETSLSFLILVVTVLEVLSEYD